MIKLLVSKKIVYLLRLKNFGYIFSGMIIPVNVTAKYIKSGFKIRRWHRYCLNNLVPFRFSLYMLIHLDYSRLWIYISMDVNINKVK